MKRNNTASLIAPAGLVLGSASAMWHCGMAATASNSASLTAAPQAKISASLSCEVLCSSASIRFAAFSLFMDYFLLCF
jgi:hypothetical protein